MLQNCRPPTVSNCSIGCMDAIVCRKEAERARDQALRRRDTLVAAAGGAGLGVVISFASEVCLPSPL